MLTAAPSTLCLEIFLSAPYSTTVPKKPALRAQRAPSSQQGGSRTRRPPCHHPQGADRTEPGQLVVTVQPLGPHRSESLRLSVGGA